MTAAAFQSLGISDDMKERLNRLVIGVATMAAVHNIDLMDAENQLLCPCLCYITLFLSVS
jgi:hypothetical protein